MEKKKKIILGAVIIVIAIVISAVVLSIVTSPFYGLDDRVKTNFELYDSNQNMYLEFNELVYRESVGLSATIEDMTNKRINNESYFQNKATETLKKYDKDNDRALNLIETHNWMVGN
ncbi:MAG: hypothetical protein LBM96_04870 [Methanobrevibacter sp.]|jgi:Ca2+-binding EF-hand superfamily protein|nr:hypothetical protein [Candidatus Methanoflexus mossambicus]